MVTNRIMTQAVVLLSVVFVKCYAGLKYFKCPRMLGIMSLRVVAQAVVMLSVVCVNYARLKDFKSTFHLRKILGQN
jgi:hypothetical protein